jgi:hypothetical protein
MGYLQYITKISGRAPQLKYIGVYHRGESYYGKRVGGEWVLCDKASFVDSTSRTS